MYKYSEENGIHSFRKDYGWGDGYGIVSAIVKGTAKELASHLFDNWKNSINLNSSDGYQFLPTASFGPFWMYFVDKKLCWGYDVKIDATIPEPFLVEFENKLRSLSNLKPFM